MATGGPRNVTDVNHEQPYVSKSSCFALGQSYCCKVNQTVNHYRFFVAGSEWLSPLKWRKYAEEDDWWRVGVASSEDPGWNWGDWRRNACSGATQNPTDDLPLLMKELSTFLLPITTWWICKGQSPPLRRLWGCEPTSSDSVVIENSSDMNMRKKSRSTDWRLEMVGNILGFRYCWAMIDVNPKDFFPDTITIKNWRRFFPYRRNIFKKPHPIKYFMIIIRRKELWRDQKTADETDTLRNWTAPQTPSMGELDKLKCMLIMGDLHGWTQLFRAS